MDSIWHEAAEKPTFRQLEGDVKTDVLIIGGGIAGVLCAYMLKRAGVDCVLVEAEKICSGITQNTTAKITLQHGLIYDKLVRRFGYEGAWLYLQAQKEAMGIYDKLCGKIECDYKRADSFVYSINNPKKIEKELLALDKIGCQAVFADRIQVPVKIAGAVCIPDQAHFHPLKFIYGIAKDLRIYERTRVLELRPDGAITDRGRIKSERIIVATHFPFINKHGSYFLKLYQHRSCVLALEGAKNADGMYVDENDKGMSFRDYNGLLLLGGGGHRTGKKGGNWEELELFAKANYPKSRVVAKWATQDCMTLDGIPYIGQYSKRTPNLYVSTGFNKWGMTSAMVSAVMLTDMVQGKSSDYSRLFSPSRTILRPQLAINAAESVMGLLTPTVPRCPHLGCALKYNRQEHSWDCSCHGSRFDETGVLLDNPATKDKRKMRRKV